MQILDLAVNGFPAPGIESRRADFATFTCVRRHDQTITYIARNYVGTDPRGRAASPNYRGIVLAGTRYSILEDNLVSGNLRAGIFVEGGVYTSIVHNRVGISSDGQPLGNSCGMFLHIGDQRSFGGVNGADAFDNVVAYNTDFGIGRTADGTISMQRNSIYGQRYGAIDAGLDLQSPNVADDTFTAPNKPILFDAYYDAANDRTIVRGRVDSSSGSVYFPFFEIDVYASHALSGAGLPQSEQWLTSRPLDSGTAGHGEFTVEIPGDLRGRYITATNTRSHYVGFAKPPVLSGEGHTRHIMADTSELSEAVQVQ